MPDYSLFGDEHVRQYEETDGEVGYLWNDATCLVLTATGRTSGDCHQTGPNRTLTKRTNGFAKFVPHAGPFDASLRW